MMALGASITYGFLSSHGNGYRQTLQGLLWRGGNDNVHYVGSRKNGTMENNEVEGWPGYRIDQIWPKAQGTVTQWTPNVILLNAGTNDCVQNWNIDNTTIQSTANANFTSTADDNIGTRMRGFINDLLAWSPASTVVLSTLVMNMDPAVNARVDNANARFLAVAQDMQAQGKRVIVAEMTPDAGGPNRNTMADQTHPNDDGYALMANKWYEAVRAAGAQGWFNA